MTIQQIDIARIQRLFSAADLKDLEDVLFYQDDDGSYYIFDVYRIIGRNKRWTIEKYGVAQDHVFSELRYALCWCINSRRNRLHAIKDIIDLDRKLISLNMDIQIQRSLLNKRIEGDLHEIKLQESMLRKSYVVKKLQEYVDESNIWQTKKFGTRVNLSEK